MFNPDMPQTSSQEEAKSASTAEEISAQIDATRAVSETEGAPESLADFANRPENMLPREGDTLPEGGMETLTGQWAEQMTTMRESETRENFQQTVAAQREMIREEFLRDEIMNGGSERQEGEKPVFSQDQVATGKSGASEWILEKLSHVPGGKKFLGALALIAGLSAVPKDAEADFFKDLGRAAGDIVTQSVRNIPRDMERQQREREQQRAAAEREAKQAARESEQMKAEYNKNLKAEVTQFFSDSTKITKEFNDQEARIKAGYRQKKDRILQGNIKDEALRKEALRDANFSYNEDMMGAAGVAWSGLHQAQGRAEAYLRLVEEKFTFAGSTGITNHSQVSEGFIRDVQADIASVMKQSRANEETLRFLERLDKVCARGELQGTVVSRITMNSGNEGTAESTRDTRDSGTRPASAVPDYRSGQQSESKASDVDYSLLSR